MEKRLLLAFVLSAAILLAWSVIFPPPQRAPQPAPTPVPQAPVSADAWEETPEPAAEIPEADERAALEISDEVEEAAVEELVTLENEVVAAVLSNRGAAVISYRLLGYDDDAGEPLDQVQTDRRGRRLSGV